MFCHQLIKITIQKQINLLINEFGVSPTLFWINTTMASVNEGMLEGPANVLARYTLIRCKNNIMLRIRLGGHEFVSNNGIKRQF